MLCDKLTGSGGMRTLAMSGERVWIVARNRSRFTSNRVVPMHPLLAIRAISNKIEKVF